MIRWLNRFILDQLVWHLTVIVILILQVVVVLLFYGTVHASRFVDPIVDTRVTYALATAVVKPPVASGAHALAGRTALVPRDALRHESDRAVDSHHVRLQRVQLSVEVGLCSVQSMSLLFFSDPLPRYRATSFTNLTTSSLEDKVILLHLLICFVSSFDYTNCEKRDRRQCYLNAK